MPYTSRHVVFIINSLEGGGAEGVMCRLLGIMQSYFTEQHAKVFLVLLDDVAQAYGAPEYVEKVVLNSNGSLLKGFSLLQSTLKKIQPALCFSFLTRANVLNVVLSKRIGYAAFISERVATSSHFAHGLKSMISKALVRFTYPKADRIVACSAGVEADLIKNFGVPKSKTAILYNPYEMEAIVTKAAEPVADLPTNPYIVATGRLATIKNFSMLITSFARSSTPFDLVILGQGELEEKLKTQAKDLGVEKRVHFLGFKKNPYPYVKQAQFFVSTSNAEGFPNAIVEAMCLSKAILATNCESGPAEIIADQYPLDLSGFSPSKFGCLSPVNDEASFTQGINFLSDKNQQARFGALSRIRADDFSNEIFERKMIDLIEGHNPKETSPYVRAG
ncbi:glycosyltransferase [Alteromonas sp. ASW11-130]|uniref:glycosyltransferase n=1 Tax=Alteromonas sp. ASW11-130 TaxID=3015775 RepID=UPI002241A57B|nr:glycosyltransferase [Alteromonas sp. ASW11-130]MCW8090403.1 glycosyltransferase [Alteromonas sp. ASW11-130]